MNRKQFASLTFTALAALALSAPLQAQTGVAVVNAAGFQPNAPVAPGSLASAFPVDGEFAGAATAAVEELPLPTTLGGAQVLIDGDPAPLVFVAASQINFQIPSGASADRHDLSVTVNGAEVAAGFVDVLSTYPGIFILDPADVFEPGAVLNQDGSVNGPDNPAAPGSVVIAFGTGQGEVDNPVADGEAAAGDPLSRTVAPTEAWVAAQEAAVSFSGLAPGFVGLWQVNLTLPDGVTGRAALFLKSGGIASNSVSVWVAE